MSVVLSGLPRSYRPWLVLGICAAAWALSAQADPLRQVTRAATRQADADEENGGSRTIRRRGDRISIFADDIEIPAGTSLEGMAFCIGCNMRIDGEVREIVIIAGSLKLTGKVRDQVVGVLSNLELDGGEVNGQLVNVAGTLERRDSYIGALFDLSLGDWLGSIPSPFGILGAIIFWVRMFKLFLAFIVILLLAAIVPERIRVIGEEAPARYGLAFVVGLLGYLGMLLIGLLLSLTVIGAPIGLLIFLVLKWLGVAGVFYAVGRRIGRSMGREMSLLGSVLLAFAIFAAATMLPSVAGFARGGWWFFLPSLVLITLGIWIFVEIPALGLVILTRAGTRSAATGGRVEPAAPPAPVYAAPRDPEST